MIEIILGFLFLKLLGGIEICIFIVIKFSINYLFLLGILIKVL